MPKPAFMRQFKDAALTQTKALPAAASSNTVSDGLDTGLRTNRAVAPQVLDAVLVLPSLTTVVVPDTRTVTLSIEASATSNFASFETLRTVTLTGAGGVGLPTGGEVRVTLPQDCPRFVRGKVAFGASTTDGSAKTFEFALKT
jgi:hypothetical protein